MPYSVKRAKRRHDEPAKMTGLYIVTSRLGARVVERKSLNSARIALMPIGFVFNGSPDGAWVKVLGGGYCVGISVREIV